MRSNAAWHASSILSGALIGQLQEGQASFISLFFDMVLVKHLLDHFMYRIPCVGCPFQEPCPVPFTVELVVCRHMVRECGILPPASIKALVAADAVPFVVNLYTAFCVPDIHFFMNGVSLKRSSSLRIAAFIAGVSKNFRLRRRAMMWEVRLPTLPSTAALSRGA